jgi:hypothetical protein
MDQLNIGLLFLSGSFTKVKTCSVYIAKISLRALIEKLCESCV